MPVVTLAGSPSPQSRSLLDFADARLRELGTEVEQISVRELPGEPLLQLDNRHPAVEKPLLQIARASAVIQRAVQPMLALKFLVGYAAILFVDCAIQVKVLGPTRRFRQFATEKRTDTDDAFEQVRNALDTANSEPQPARCWG